MSVQRRVRGPEPGAIHRRTDQACRGMDTNLFYRHDEASIRRALNVCGMCPRAAVEACLEFALNTPERDDYGIAGGMTPTERKAERRKRAREARAEAAA